MIERGRAAACLFLLAGVLCAPAPALALKTGAAPPAISAPDVDGHLIDLTALKGKVVLIDFWASWCGPCKKELPFLQSMYEKFKARGFVVIGVNIDKRTSNLNRALESLSLDFPIIHDSDHAIVGKYKPKTMPSSYVLGRDGSLRRVHRGFRSSDKPSIEALISTLLGE